MHELKGVLPVLRNMKEFERLLKSDHEYIIFLEIRLAQLKQLVQVAKKAKKKVILHVDLIQGLKTDSYGFEYLVREVKPDGIVSTRSNVIALAKKNNLMTIQRLFLLDSQALEHNINLINQVKPDYIEILPGIIPSVIKEVFDKTGIPVIAGGLIRTKEDILLAYDGGAKAISTSQPELWEL
ncbi:glycerol-3-phosphate responsive antiterminator [Microbacterium sp. APC 3898]|uniref:Glycerol uptake operon antiterminator regulatory protein n=2 Tax=Planococcus TaxID=1372 RepID=A0ABT7ZF63_9BACL|nr:MULTISPECIES: glycerol-3-phosphate responsive antiterminator [Terrabacteria group]MBF6634674.1 glycerol-3-phosphate responsive antiterminator [Planococcus sp. (in: firmicutes)]MBD8013487.1 glycerol-3-phosphate responsive antiterminator [Planococcus wigleyi]MDN3425785.1 glycerol-3-phosphate responsive antiterminator [Planococcus sp. APC 4016]MDN3437379.1 glycerol-3-phosphate responsive antiterminator [Planococcus sp. APC 3900]MDN3500583.1 glycerol-3-phosphate responsive antiterminator [Micro